MHAAEEMRTMSAVQSINQKMSDIKLRDLFAMHALPLLFEGSGNGTVNGRLKKDENFAKELAEQSYEIADAMLEARRKNYVRKD